MTDKKPKALKALKAPKAQRDPLRDELDSYVPGASGESYAVARRRLRAVDPKVRRRLLDMARAICKPPVER